MQKFTIEFMMSEIRGLHSDFELTGDEDGFSIRWSATRTWNYGSNETEWGATFYGNTLREVLEEAHYGATC